MTVTIRSYRPMDHSAGRALWAELVGEHHARYDDPGYGGAEPGAGFDEYLTRLDLSGVWVAEHSDDGVVGLIGLVMDGPAGTVQPVVVAARRRGQGIGRRLLDHVADEGRRRGLARLTVAPSSRNVEAIRRLHAAGYDVLSSIELTLELRPGSGDWRTGPDLYDLRFRS